jgi:hypothetical protein
MEEWTSVPNGSLWDRWEPPSEPIADKNSEFMMASNRDGFADLGKRKMGPHTTTERTNGRQE